MAASRGRTDSSVAASPPTMIVRVPSRAPFVPPVTGASRNRPPRSATRAARRRVCGGKLVPMSITVYPGAIARAAPPAPNRTSSTSSAVGSIMIASSVRSTASSAVEASTAPFPTSRSTPARLRCASTTTPWPAARRCPAIGSPISPTPKNATRAIAALLRPPSLRPRDQRIVRQPLVAGLGDQERVLDHPGAEAFDHDHRLVRHGHPRPQLRGVSGEQPGRLDHGHPDAVPEPARAVVRFEAGPPHRREQRVGHVIDRPPGPHHLQPGPVELEADVQQRAGGPGRAAHGGAPADVGHVAVPAGSQVDEHHLALHQRPPPRLPVLQPGLNPADHAGRKGFARAERVEPRDPRRRRRGLLGSPCRTASVITAIRRSACSTTNALPNAGA